MSTGIYCGSFSPVHKGHIRIVNEIINENLVDKVLIVPTEPYWYKNDLIPLKDRINMLKFYESDRIEIETKLNGIKASDDGFLAYQKLHPNEKLHLIIGADNLPKFNEWINYEHLLLYPFIVIKRDDYDEEYIRNRMIELNKENYHILSIDNIDISSTYIRENFDDYEKIKDKLDIEVYTYLLENNIKL